MAPKIVPQEKGAKVSAEMAEKEHDCKEAKAGIIKRLCKDFSRSLLLVHTLQLSTSPLEISSSNLSIRAVQANRNPKMKQPYKRLTELRV
jgi:hypothetical protein